jgi:hypothetical protein
MRSFKSFILKEDFAEKDLPVLFKAIKEITSTRDNLSHIDLFVHLQENYGFNCRRMGKGQSATVYSNESNKNPEYIIKIFNSNQDHASFAYLEYCRQNPNTNPFLPRIPFPEEQPLFLNKSQRMYITEYVKVVSGTGDRDLKKFFGAQKFKKFIEQTHLILGGDVDDSDIGGIPRDVVVFDYCVGNLLLEETSKYEEPLAELFGDKFIDFLEWLQVYDYIVENVEHASLDFGFGNYGFRPKTNHMVIFDPLTTSEF